jgi:hypothetical protein
MAATSSNLAAMAASCPPGVILRALYPGGRGGLLLRIMAAVAREACKVPHKSGRRGHLGEADKRGCGGPRDSCGLGEWAPRPLITRQVAYG